MAEIDAGLSGQVADIRKTSEEQIALNRRMNEEQTASNRKLNEEQIAANKQFLEEQAIANKKLSEGQIAEVKELLENATSQLESIKTDLSKKYTRKMSNVIATYRICSMSLIPRSKKWTDGGWCGLCQRLCEAVVLVFNLKFCSIDYFYFILYGSISLLMVYNMTPALPASVSFFF